MEEVKKVHEEGVCAHSCVDMHKFCSKQCCIVRCAVVVIVLFGTFALGCAYGSHLSNRFDSRDGYHRSGRQMMQFDSQSYRGGQYMMNEGYGAMSGRVTGYRIMGQPTQLQIQAIPATDGGRQVPSVPSTNIVPIQ